MSRSTNFRDGGESVRRAITGTLAWGGWLATILLGLWSSLHYNPAQGEFAPQWVGLSFILSVGVAIAAGAARGRHKLTDTVLAAFAAGVEAARLRQDEMEDRIKEDRNA